jgi:glycosyltransferase involved in cell wall biosynthesis
MINSDALFLTLSPSHKFAIEMRSTNPSKLFEYIGCGKPILAYLPRGSTQILITENNLGFVLTKYQTGEMAKFIKELMNNESLRENFSKNALILAKKFDSKLVYQTFLKRISLRKS